MLIISMILKTIVIYFIVALVFRLMGKKEVGQLGTFDLVIFILMAEVGSLSIQTKGNFIANTIPIFVMLSLQVILSKITLKNEKLRYIVDGKPIILISKGKINFKNMVDQNYSLDDLLLQLRQSNIRSIDEVDYAILEINGRLSIFKKEDKDSKTYPLPIILDGKVNFDNLYSINKSKDWLLNTLVNKKVLVDEIFYAFVKNNNLYIIKKDDL